jgi:hypothetical protein
MHNVPHHLKLPHDDPEVKKAVHAIQVAATDMLPVDRLFQRCSSWLKIRRVVAWILTMMKTLSTWSAQRKLIREQLVVTESNPDNVNELTETKMKLLKNPAIRLKIQDICLHVDTLSHAEHNIVKLVQEQHYCAELMELESSNSGVKQSSSLYKLDPFVEHGILRVGGLIVRSVISYDRKHQMLVPQKYLLAKVILHDLHRNVGHMGKNAMLSELRKHLLDS